jgi:hypothetical protein
MKAFYGIRQPASGSSRHPAAGCRQPEFTGKSPARVCAYWLPDAGCRLPVAGCRLPVAV